MARRKLSSEINVVPYIDVMLVLLIIFMVTAPLMTQGIEVDLPDVKAQSMTSQEEDKVLTVNSAGQFTLSFAPDKEKPLSDDEVITLVGDMVRTKPEAMIIVNGDGKVPYERVAQAMSLLNQANAKKIGFQMQPGAEGPKPATK
jgi:biopolymer transport protein TolR